MTIHLIKVCVGAQSIDDLIAWRDRVTQPNQRMAHSTRMTPKRAAALLDGGSLYWVIKRRIQARQQILDLEERVDEDGVRRCLIWLDYDIKKTSLVPKRPFQGWRYLATHAAPEDLSTQSGGDSLPENLRQTLIDIGAW